MSSCSGLTTEVAVVGSGLSGAAVAAAFGARGVDCLVLEAGSDRGRDHIGLAAATRELESPLLDGCFRPFLDSPGEVYGPTTGYRMRVGGRGLYWRGIALRIEDEVLSGWPAPVRRALVGTADEAGCYDIVEAEIANWMEGRGLSEPRSPAEASLAATLVAAGRPAVPTPRAVRFRAGGWEAYTPLAGVDPSWIRPNVTVGSVDPDPGAGYLVRPDPGPAIRARQVVLCAGVFGNLRLVDRLLRQYAASTVPAAYPILDHVATGMVRFEPGGPGEQGALEEPGGPGAGAGERDCSVFAGHHVEAASNLFAERSPVDGGALLDIWAMGDPQAAIALSFRSGVAHVRFEGSARRAVATVLAAQRDLVREAATLLGVPLAEDATTFDEAVSRARAEPGVGRLYVATLGDLDHECGGLPLGGDLVTESGALRHFPGIHVAGPCLFPRAGAANPTLTNLALARYVAAVVGAG